MEGTSKGMAVGNASRLKTREGKSMGKMKGNAVLGIAVLSLFVAFGLFAGCGKSSSVTSPAPQEASLPDLVAPQAPAVYDSPRITSGSTVLRWNTSEDPDVAGYNVYMYDPTPTRNGSYVKLNTALVTTTHYRVNGLVPGQRYYYRITAKDSAGNESTYSEPILVYQSNGVVPPESPKVSDPAE